MKDYAYTFIAEQYIQRCFSPLILGLTASPGSEKNKIQKICNNLFFEHLQYKTEEDADVKPYINPIDVKWKRLDLPSEYHYDYDGPRELIRKERESKAIGELYHGNESLNLRIKQML